VHWDTAKGFEVADRGIFELGGMVSGHTLKHLAAAGAVACLVQMLRMRARISGAESLVQTPPGPAYWPGAGGAMDAAPVDPA
jgi:hypothetical protein